MNKSSLIDPLLGVSQAEEATGLSRVQLYRRYTQEPPTFPLPRYVGNKRVWPLSVIRVWLEQEMARPASARRGAKNLAGSAQTVSL